MKKTILSAVVLATILIVAAPAVAQVGQGFDQDSDSGVVDQSFTVTGEGSFANQCSALLAAAQTGNSQGATGSIRSNSGIGESEQEDIGSSLAVSPELAEECEQKINQAAAAASSPKQTPKAAPKATPAPALKPADEVEGQQAKATATQARAESKVEEKKTKTEEKKTKTEEKKAGAKELPKTGGGGATLFALGAGALLVAGGLLARRVAR